MGARVEEATAREAEARAEAMAKAEAATAMEAVTAMEEAATAARTTALNIPCSHRSHGSH